MAIFLLCHFKERDQIHSRTELLLFLPMLQVLIKFYLMALQFLQNPAGKQAHPSDKILIVPAKPSESCPSKDAEITSFSTQNTPSHNNPNF